MDYGKLPVHHLEPEIVKTWNPVKVFGYGTPHIQQFDNIIWNEPLPDDILTGMDAKIRDAIAQLDEKYTYAVDGRVNVHERRTSIEVDLGMENELWEKIFNDFMDLAGSPNYIDNSTPHTHNLDPILEHYGKRLDGCKVVDTEKAA